MGIGLKKLYAGSQDVRVVDECYRHNFKELRKGKKTVAFCGMSPQTRTKAPWDDLTVDVWTMNRSWRDHLPGKDPYVKRITKHWEIHPEKFQALENKPDARHEEWLRLSHPFPIFMDEKYEQYPSSVRYDIERAVNEYGRHFTSSMTYMFPQAEWEGYDRIELWGFEMKWGGEYAYQLPELAYHIGWFRAKHGYNSVYVPEESPILRSLLYAYEEMYNPLVTVIEQRMQSLEFAKQTEECNAHHQAGYIEALDEFAEKLPWVKHIPEWEALRAEKRETFRKTEIQINQILGARQDLGVAGNLLWYHIPPSYKEVKYKEAMGDETWDKLNYKLPWREESNVEEAQEAGSEGPSERGSEERIEGAGDIAFGDLQGSLNARNPE